MFNKCVSMVRAVLRGQNALSFNPQPKNIYQLSNTLTYYIGWHNNKAQSPCFWGFQGLVKLFVQTR
jgi:hypothetical protein